MAEENKCKLEWGENGTPQDPKPLTRQTIADGLYIQKTTMMPNENRDEQLKEWIEDLNDRVIDLTGFSAIQVGDTKIAGDDNVSGTLTIVAGENVSAVGNAEEQSVTIGLLDEIDLKSVKTENLSATNITADNITANNIDVKELTAENAEIENLSAADIETTNLSAENANIENLSAENLSAYNFSAENGKFTSIEVMYLSAYQTSAQVITAVSAISAMPGVNSSLYGFSNIDGGNITASGKLNVSGDTTLKGKLDVDKATTLKDTLDVVGSAGFDSDVTVDGTTIFNSDVQLISAANTEVTSFSSIIASLDSNKMDKVVNPTEGHIAILDENGNVIDGDKSIEEVGNYKAGEHIAISDDKTISVTGTAELSSVSLNIDDNDDTVSIEVNEEWLENKTKYTAGEHIDISDDREISVTGMKGLTSESLDITTNENDVSIEVNEEWLADHTVSDSYLTRAKNEGSVTVSDSYALGISVSALGMGSVAEGNKSIASGDYSHAEGAITTADGTCSHAEGYKTSALGDYSHAEGFSTSAIRNYSHAEGENTIASGRATHAQGKYNTFENADKAFIIGNGNFSKRSDAMVVDWDGNVSAAGYFYDKDGKVGDDNSYLIDYNDSSTKIKLGYEGAGIESITPTTTITATKSKYLAGYVKYGDKDIRIKDVNPSAVSGIGHATNADKANLLKVNHTNEINFVNTATNPSSAVWFNYRVEKSDGSTANSAVYKIYRFANGNSGSVTDVTAFTDTISANHYVGYNCIVSGFNTIAFGHNTSAIQNYAMAAGESSIASGWYSHAEGKFTSAFGGVSHAEGESTYAANEQAHAEGYKTSALGLRSHAEGLSAIASGNVSHSEGASTSALGTDSHAEGLSAIASGGASHAEGKGTSAIGYASHAEGEYTMASGNYSHAAGSGTTAVNEGVFAHGKGLKLAYNYGIALGRFNKTSGGDTLLVVGNGNAEDKRNDAFLIDGWGNVSAAGTISDKNGRLTNLTKVNNVSEITDDGAFYII